MISPTVERLAKLFPDADPTEIGPLDVQLAILETLLSIKMDITKPLVMFMGHQGWVR